MCYNKVSTVRVLLACRTIRLGNTNRDSGRTGLYCACGNNHVECVELFLAHPACTKQIVTMMDKNKKTAEMMAKNMAHHDCVRIIREFIDKTDDVEMMDGLHIGNVDGVNV